MDNRNVAGLKGTGSNDTEVENAFIPEHRTHRLAEPSKNTFNAPIFALPFGNVLGLCYLETHTPVPNGIRNFFRAVFLNEVGTGNGYFRLVRPRPT